MVVVVQLSEVGDDSFIAAEGEATLQMPLPDECIVSLSGSSPLHRDAMRWIRQCGPVIYLDTHHSDILARLSNMKVDRIVGRGSDIASVLQYRQQFYEGINNCLHSNSINCVLVFQHSRFLKAVLLTEFSKPIL